MKSYTVIVVFFIVSSFLACEDRLYEPPKGSGDFAKDLLAQVSVTRNVPLQIPNGPMEISVTYNGMGSSDLLDEFELVLSHTEYHFGGIEFSVRNGSFQLKNKHGDQMTGTYLGVGVKSLRHLNIKQTWIVTSASGYYQSLQGKTLFAHITRSPFDGSSEVVLTGNIN